MEKQFNGKENQATNKFEAAVVAYQNSGLSEAQKENYREKASLAFMQAKHFSAFCGSSGAYDDGLLTDKPNAFKYDGEIIVKAVDYALKNYGKLDEKTGKVIPAMQLANSVYNRQKGEIIKRKLDDEQGDNQKATEHAVRVFLTDTASRRGIKGLNLRFNVLNKDKVEKYMSSKGFYAEDIERYCDILETSYVSSDTVTSDDDGEEGSTCVSDYTVYNRYAQRRSIVDAMLNKLDRVYSAGNVNTQKYVSLLVTFHIHNTPLDDGDVKTDLERYVDNPFKSFLGSHPEFDSVVDAIVSYTGNKRETVLKSLVLARKNLNALASKGSAACL
ncbi:MAG: hypothetical protein Q4D21_03140 [Phascolarctobacterium sp.]|nr:hypothetical protein [Phascolarctobacterium sp.]